MHSSLGTALVAIVVTASTTACGITAITTQAKSVTGRALTIAPAPPDLGSLSAASIQEKMISAMNSAGSVHVTLHTRAGALSETYSDDSLAHSGRQRITLSNGARSEVLVINAVAYAQGNYEALTTFYGFPGSVASRYAGQWISFRKGEAGYQQVAAGVTLPGVISELKLGAPLSKLPAATVGGTPVVRLRGRPTSSGVPAGTRQTIEIAASGSALPVSSEAVYRGLVWDVTFSNWGETLHLSAPVSATSISAVLG